MASREDLQWIIIDDFSPGIWNPRVGSAQPAPHLVYFGYGSHKTPLGAAQVNGTWGCVCSPSGALIPGPSTDYTFNQARLTPGSTYPNGENRNVVLASHIVSPVYPYTALSMKPPTTFRPDALFVLFGTFHDPAAGVAYQQRVNGRYYKAWNATPPSAYDFLGGAMSQALMASGGVFAAPWLHAYADFADMVGSAGGTGAVINQLAAFYQMCRVPVGVAAPATRTLAFPDYTNSAADSPINLTNMLGNGMMILGHQGRLLGIFSADLALGGEPFGASAALPGGNDITAWSQRDAQASAPQSVYRPIEENQSGIRVAASMNANELVIIKSRGGGAVFSGDVINPTIKRMPGFASTGLISCKPIATPAGLFYAGTEGVYAWTGNDVSERVSKQLDGGFWIPSDTIARAGYSGQMEYLDPWVLVPNNFMYDTRFQSWWRLSNPTSRAFFSYHPSADGSFWALPGYIDDNNLTLGYHFSPSHPADTYSWTSQPMTPIPGHLVRVRDIMLMVEGNGTIFIGGTSSIATVVETIGEPITFNVTVPTVIRVNVSMVTESITLALTVGAAVVGNPAPAIHGLRIGYEPDVQHPSNN